MPVYEFEGQHYDLPDGLSNEQALAKIKSHLGQNQPSAKQQMVSDTIESARQGASNWSDQLRGVAETGLSLVTGLGAMAAAPIVSGLSQLGGRPEGKVGVEQAMERMTFEPRTEAGKETAANVGELINRYVVPAATGVQGLPYTNTLAPLLEATAGRLTRVGRATPKEVVKTAEKPVKAVDAAIAELSTPAAEKTPVSDVAFWKERAAEMERQAQAEQAAQGQRPITVGPEGVEMPGMRSAEEALSAFDRQVRRADREVPTEGTDVLQVDRQGQVFIPERAEDVASTELARKLQALQEADRLREEQQSALAQRAGQQVQEEMFGAPELFDLQHAGEMPAREVPPPLTEQPGLFEPHPNMHRPYTEMFASEGGKTRPFSFNEFKEILNNLKEEPGTRFQMPEDLRKAYQDYLAHPEHGQRDFFGAEYVPDIPSHKTYGELSPQKRGVMTRKMRTAETISDEMLQRMQEQRLFGDAKLRAGFTKEDMAKLFSPGFTKTMMTTLPDGKKAKLSVKYDNTYKELVVTASGSEGPLGYVKVPGNAEVILQNPSDSRIAVSADTMVLDSAQRRGVATAMYDALKKLGLEMSPSADQTAAGKAMWEGFQKKGRTVEENGIVKFNAGLPIAEDMDFGVLKQLFGGGGDTLKNIPGIGDRLRNIGNARIETPELAIKLAKETPDIKQNKAQQIINQLTKGGEYQKGKVNNPVYHFTVDRLLKADDVARADVSENVHGIYLDALRSLTKEEYVDAYKLLEAADMNQKPLTPEFLAKHGFSDNLQNFILAHQEQMNQALGKINEAREAAGKKPVKARIAYSAMNMTGDFRKVVTKNGEVVGVIGKDTKQGLAKLEESLKTKDAGYEFGPLQDMSKSGKSTKGTPHEALMDVLDILGEDNPQIADFITALKEVAKDDPYNYLGMQKHTMQKKGVFGMEGRKPWLSAEENAKQFFENQVKYLEGSYRWGELSKAALDVNTVLRDEGVVTKQPNAIAMSEKYLQNALGINPSRIGRSVTDLFNSMFASAGVGPSIPRNAIQASRVAANTMMLSLNVPFLAIQLIQPLQAMPAMSALLRGRGAASGMTWITQGFDHMGKAIITLGKDVSGVGALTAVERGALDYARKNHIYASDMVEHTNQTQKGAAYVTSKITQSPAAKLETGTRAVTYMTLVDMLHSNGLTPKNGLYEQAHRFTDMVMNHYGQMEKPRVYEALGPLGSMAYNLRSFGHNEISRWALYAREIANTGNPAPLLTQMATTIAFAGVMGLPFFSQWETLYDYITKKLGSPRSLALDVMQMSEELGKKLGIDKNVLSHGLPALAGMDLSKRVGLGDVLPSSASDAAFAGGSKLGEAMKAVGQAAMHPTQEEYLKKAAISVAPNIAQGPMDVSWYQKGNLAFSKDPENLKPMVRRTDRDILLKKIGLTGIHESTEKQKVYQQAQLDKAYQEYRSQAMNKIKNDLFYNRPITKDTLDKYFVTGQGDPSTFEADLSRLALEQNLSPQEFLTLKQAASTKIPQLRSLQRRMQ